MPGLRYDLTSLYRSLSPQRRRQGWLVIALMPFTALAEMVTIGAIVPLLAVLASPGEPVAGLGWTMKLLGWVEARTAGEQLAAAAILFLSAAAVAAGMRLLLTWSSQRFAYDLGHELAVEIQRRVLLQPYLFHAERHSSATIASLDKVDLLVFDVVLQLVQALSATIIALFVLAALVQLDVKAAAIAALLVVLLYGIALLAVRKRLAASAEAIAGAHEQRIRTVQESLGGIRDIILDHSQTETLETFRAIDGRFMRARADMAFASAAPRFLVEVAGLAVITGLALFLATRPGGLTAALPVLGALALGAQRLLPLTQQLFRGWSALAGGRPIIRQVVELIDLPVPPDAVEPPTAVIDFTRGLRLERVSFTYPGRPRPALDDINLTIAKGSRVALVGRTGSGKSTLADLIMGLLDPTAGRILVDDVALTADRARAWQRNIAHVPQAIFLADASIARNIALGAPSAALDLARIGEAAEIAQITRFVDTLPEGFDTRVGERGVRLSGGQRQRLGLARAIYRQAPLLVLDEATSALDEVTEAAVMSALDTLAGRGRTILIIAHRTSTVASCDQVVRLEAGRIVAAGSYAELFGARQPAELDLES